MWNGVFFSVRRDVVALRSFFFSLVIESDRAFRGIQNTFVKVESFYSLSRTRRAQISLSTCEVHSVRRESASNHERSAPLLRDRRRHIFEDYVFCRAAMQTHSVESTPAQCRSKYGVPTISRPQSQVRKFLRVSAWPKRSSFEGYELTKQTRPQEPSAEVFTGLNMTKTFQFRGLRVYKANKATRAKYGSFYGSQHDQNVTISRAAGLQSKSTQGQISRAKRGKRSKLFRKTVAIQFLAYRSWSFLLIRQLDSCDAPAISSDGWGSNIRLNLESCRFVLRAVLIFRNFF